MTNADLARLINSNEIQGVVNPAKKNVRIHDVQKKNPKRNLKMRQKLNPFAIVNRNISKQSAAEALKRKAQKTKPTKQVKDELKRRKRASKAFMQNVVKNIDDVAAKDRHADDEFRLMMKGEKPYVSEI